MPDATNTVVEIKCQAVLLDIEGTVAPVTFVYDVMFPYIRENVASFLESSWTDDSVQQAVALVGKDVGQEDVADWLGSGSVDEQRQIVVAAVNQLMDNDAKVTGLKQLQGMIWKDGFDSGQLVAQLFPDVPPKLNEWKADGLELYIYSSGSIGAQKLFFGHTTAGDLLDLFLGYFDTTSGNKKESDSYRTIAEQIGKPPHEICFISDVVAELDAAEAAGMQTILRADETSAASSHTVVTTFQTTNFHRTG